MAGQFTTVGIELVIRRMANFNRGMATLRRQMGLTGAQTFRMSKSFKSASTAILDFGQSVRNVGNQVLILGFQLTFLASGAMASFIQKGVEFERSMVKIITLVGVAEGRVAAWADEILDAATGLGKTPTELAEALFVITSAGIRDQAEAMDVLTASAKAASIGLGETEAVARVVTGAMQAYEDTNLTAAQAVDILVGTVREGNLEVESLAPTLGRVIATAANMGVTFEEVGAFIATFSRTAVPAEVAVTSLRSALNSILKPTAASKEKLAEYNISIQEVWEAIRDPEKGLSDTLLALTAVFGDNNEEMAEVIGSARALAGIFTVTGGLADEYREILNELKNSTGLTDEAFDRFTKTTAFMGASAKASLETLAITVGQILLPGLNRLLETIIPVFEKIRDFAALHPKITLLAGAIGAVVTAIGPLLIISGLLISSLGTLIIAIGSFTAFLGSLLTPIGVVIGAIAAVFAGIAFAIGISLDEAQEKLNKKGKSLTTSALGWGRNLILAFAKGMGSVAGAITKVLILIGQHIRDLLQGRSPPKLLPDITNWGIAAMEAYLDGWLLADFNIFNQVADLMEKAVRSLTFESELWDGWTEKQAIEGIIKTRSKLADAIEEIRRTGVLTEDTLNSVIVVVDDYAAAVGDSAEQFKDYIRELLAVEYRIADLEKAEDALASAERRHNHALEQLNNTLDDTKKKYEDLLAPINEEISALEKSRQAILDQREVAELELLIADANAPEEAKYVARMRLRHMELVRQREEVENTRDAEVERAEDAIRAQEKLRDKELKLLRERVKASEDALDAARATLAATQAQIEVQIENNELLKEMIQLYDKAEDKVEDVADALGDLGEIIGGGLEDFFPPEFTGGEGEGGPLENLFGIDIEEMLAEVEAILLEAREEFWKAFGDKGMVEELQDIWSDIIVEALEGIDDGEIVTVMQAFLKGAFAGVLEGIEEEGGWIAIGELMEYIIFAGNTKPTFGEHIGEAINTWLTNLVDLVKGAWTALVEDRALGTWMIYEVLNRTFLGSIIADAWGWVAEQATGTNPFEQMEDTMAFEGWQDAISGFYSTEGRSPMIADIFGRIDEETETLPEQIDAVGESLRNVGNISRDELTPEIIDKLTPAFRGVAGYMDERLVPVFDRSGGRMQKIAHVSDRETTPAMTTLNDFLVTSLGPTIGETIYGVLESIIEKFTEWKDLVSEPVQEAIEALEEFLGVDFSETVEGVSSFFDETFGPAVEDVEEVFDSLREFLEGAFTTAANGVRTNVLDPLQTAVNNVKGAVEDLLSKVIELINKLPFINIPDPFVEESPSPFELGIRHTISAMDEMASRAAPMLGASLRGELGSHVNMYAHGRVARAKANGGIVNNNKTVQVNFGGQNINNGMDAASFSALVDRAMRNAL